MNPLFHRIMIACDLSKMDEKLMRCAGNLARNTDIQKIYLLHVISNESSKVAAKVAHSKSDGIYPLDEKVRFDLAEKARKKIDAWSIDVEIIVLKGHVYNQLLHFVETNEIDLIILGQKKGEEGKGLMAKRLARNVSSSVLFLTGDSSVGLDSVLVPVDFSKNSAKALRTAIQYKNNMEQPVKIKGLHVAEMAPSDSGSNQLEKQAMEAEQLAETEKSYQEFLDSNDIDGGDLEKIIITDEFDNVSERIYSDIKKADSKLVIMGAKGQSAIEKYFYGSVTERLVDENTEVPVLVVR